MSCGTATEKVDAFTEQNNHKNNLKSGMIFHIGIQNFLIILPG